jgi:VWFA-related protein
LKSEIPRKTAGWVIAWLSAGLLATPILGQAPTAPANQGPPVLRVTTHLVQADVIVQDKKGNPVSDLTRDDFVLRDQGKKQPISVFSVESNQALSPPAQPLPPDTFTNRLEYRGSVPHSLTVILLDTLNTGFGDQAYAKAQIVRFLSQLQPQDRVALYALGGSIRILHDFTSDAAPLIRTLARYRGDIPPGSVASELPGPEPGQAAASDMRSFLAGGSQDLNGWLRESDQSMSDFLRRNRELDTCAALEAIAQHLARFPGRKNMIWVSAGLPVPRDPKALPLFVQEIDRATRALNDANVAVYPVDARGLIGVPALAASNPQIGRTSDFANITANIATMKEMAERTGGRAFYNDNDIKGAVRTAIADSRTTYLLGYYPSHGQWDGKFREIKIKVNRPGLRLRYRRGYLALAPGSSSEAERNASMEAAVWSPLDPTTVRLTVKAQATPGSTPASGSISLAMQIDPHDITFRPENDRWVGSIDLVFVELDAQGRNLHGESATIRINLIRPNYEKLLQGELGELAINRDLQITPGTFRVRVVVRDGPSEALGGVSIPLSKFLSGAVE